MLFHSLLWIGFLGLWLAGSSVPAAGDETDLQELKSLGQEAVTPSQRLDDVVTSAAKKRQRVSAAAAAVHVISREDIRRSGVTSIPEALRLAPGLQVARIDSNKWAISARGFNGRFANKLLVLMDGREVYSALFGGVYWEAQDYPLDDIERIEVIRGPGAALWGANAVNGVINIITRHAADSRGGSLSAGGGSHEQGFGSLRHGFELDEDTHARVYAKGNRRGSFENWTGNGGHDDWSHTGMGFRLDRDRHDGDRWFLSGAAYQTDQRQQVLLPKPIPVPGDFFSNNLLAQHSTRLSGFNLLGRWSRALSLASELSLQAFVDHSYVREITNTQERDILDIELQHRLLWGERHDTTWGMGYRLLLDHFGDNPYISLQPKQANKQLFSLFLQDDITLLEKKLALTLGAKLQHNDFSGFEGQPTVRLLWTPDPKHTWWAALSRAVRTPNRSDCCSDLRVMNLSRDLANGLPFSMQVQNARNPRFRAEKVWTYELGYRFQPRADFSLDLAAFYSDYSDLRSWEANPNNIRLRPIPALSLQTANLLQARSYGAELAVDWQARPGWKLQAAYGWLKTDYSAGRLIVSPEKGTDPRHQAWLRSSFDVAATVDLDLWLRYVSGLYLESNLLPQTRGGVPGYLTLDARLAWRPLAGLELALVGQNLLEGQHQEFSQEAFGPIAVSVPRSFYLQANWRF